jgi:hypothetical protein
MKVLIVAGDRIETNERKIKIDCWAHLSAGGYRYIALA